MMGCVKKKSTSVFVLGIFLATRSIGCAAWCNPGQGSGAGDSVSAAVSALENAMNAVNSANQNAANAVNAARNLGPGVYINGQRVGGSGPGVYTIRNGQLVNSGFGGGFGGSGGSGGTGGGFGGNGGTSGGSGSGSGGPAPSTPPAPAPSPPAPCPPAPAPAPTLSPEELDALIDKKLTEKLGDILARRSTRRADDLTDDELNQARENTLNRYPALSQQIKNLFGNNYELIKLPNTENFMVRKNQGQASNTNEYPLNQGGNRVGVDENRIAKPGPNPRTGSQPGQSRPSYPSVEQQPGSAEPQPKSAESQPKSAESQPFQGNQTIAKPGPKLVPESSSEEPTQQKLPAGPSAPKTSAEKSTEKTEPNFNQPQLLRPAAPIYEARPRPSYPSAGPNPYPAPSTTFLPEPKPIILQPKRVNRPQPIYSQPKPIITQQKLNVFQPKPFIPEPRPLISQPKPIATQPKKIISQPNLSIPESPVTASDPWAELLKRLDNPDSIILTDSTKESKPASVAARRPAVARPNPVLLPFPNPIPAPVFRQPLVPTPVRGPTFMQSPSSSRIYPARYNSPTRSSRNNNNYQQTQNNYQQTQNYNQQSQNYRNRFQQFQ